MLLMQAMAQRVQEGLAGEKPPIGLSAKGRRMKLGYDLMAMLE